MPRPKLQPLFFISDVFVYNCFFFFRRSTIYVYRCLCLRVVFRTCSCVDFSQSPVLPCLNATQLMGWGGMLKFLALAATQLMGWDVNVPCTCTHVGSYAIDGVGWGGMLTFLALAHMLDATQLMGWGGVGCMLTFLALAGMFYARNWWGGMLTFLALAHMFDAKQLVGWDVNVPCTCTHVGCYAIDGDVPCTCTHVGCYAIDGVGWGGMYVNVHCTCTHVGCYAKWLHKMLRNAGFQEKTIKHRPIFKAPNNMLTSRSNAFTSQEILPIVNSMILELDGLPNRHRVL